MTRLGDGAQPEAPATESIVSRADEHQGLPNEHDRRMRRRFLLAMGGMLAGGLGGGLTGCRRDGSETSGQAATGRMEPEGDLAPPVVETRPPIPASEPLIRVRIARVDGEDGPIRIGEPGQWLRIAQPSGWEHGQNVGAGRGIGRGMAAGLREMDRHEAWGSEHWSGSGPVQLGLGAAMRGPLDIAAWSRGWLAVDADGFRAPLQGFEPVRVLIASDEPHGSDAPGLPTITMNDAAFPGFLQVVARTDESPGAFDVVNHVSIESYLPGVVAKELYNHWHVETHRAQAVAARSFACAEIAHFVGRRHFDVTNTQASQVYAGRVRHRRSIAAVEATRGELLAHDGLLMHAYYSSCCGGLAACATDAIGSNVMNDIPPLQGQAKPDVCQSAPVYEWENVRGREEVTRRLIAFGRSTQHPTLPDLVAITSFAVEAVNAHGRPTAYTVSDRAGQHVTMSAESLRRAINYVGQGLHPPKRALRSSNFTATVEKDHIVFVGHGFGHGVGMCQHGAEIHARAGRTYREILQWYYPGAELVRAWM